MDLPLPVVVSPPTVELTVNDLVIDGTMGLHLVFPNPSGQSGRFVTNNGSSLSWGDVNLSTGIGLNASVDIQWHMVDQVV